MWYKDWFADEHYLALYQHRDKAEALQLLDLVERTAHPTSDARILDLACGAGRHSISLAKRGYTNITGIDLSSTLINIAKASAEEQKVKVEFIESDMLHFQGQYDLILNLFTSFGYFETDADNEAVINKIGNALTPNGYFVIDFFNATLVEQTLVPHSTKVLPSGETVDECRVIADRRVNKKIIIRSADTTKEYYESVRLFTLQELRAMIERAAMKCEQVFGCYNGDPFDEQTSTRCIIVAKKTNAS